MSVIQVPVAIFLARPTAMYHSLGAGDSLPVISTNEGRGEILKTVPALMGKILLYSLEVYSTIRRCQGEEGV